MADEQTVLVAGATGNVGGAAAAALALRGMDVVMLGCDPVKQAEKELIA